MAAINPRVDIAFKKIFGVDENKDLLISLINSVVSKEDQVASVTILNPHNAKSFQADKLSILDVKALGIDGKRFNVEIQVADEADCDKRALYYWAKLYTEQLQDSSDHNSLSKVISIHILNFTSIFDGSSSQKELVAKVKSSLDMWVAFLTQHELLSSEELPNAFDDPSLKKALKIIRIMTFSDIERQAYDDHLKRLRIETNALKKYELDIQKMKEDSLKIGEEKGRTEGRKQERIRIAKRLLARGLMLGDVAEITGLSNKDLKNV